MNKSHYHYGRRCGRREMMPIAALMRVSTEQGSVCEFFAPRVNLLKVVCGRRPSRNPEWRGRGMQLCVSAAPPALLVSCVAF